MGSRSSKTLAVNRFKHTTFAFHPHPRTSKVIHSIQKWCVHTNNSLHNKKTLHVILSFFLISFNIYLVTIHLFFAWTKTNSRLFVGVMGWFKSDSERSISGMFKLQCPLTVSKLHSYFFIIVGVVFIIKYTDMFWFCSRCTTIFFTCNSLLLLNIKCTVNNKSNNWFMYNKTNTLGWCGQWVNSLNQPERPTGII